MRKALIERKTAETNIKLSLELDGTGKSSISTGCGFMDHMLTLFAHHGKFDIELTCDGDTGVDYHHSIEDIGICLGEAFTKALGDKKGIFRYGTVILPMDEALILSSVDISGRAVLRYTVSIPSQKIGDLDTELIKEFWLAFVRNSGITLHIKELDGENSHHIAECIFKATARALSKAVCIDEQNKDIIPSTKGVL